LEKLGVHDNFFELGGDSILSIQVMSRARQAGLQLAPRQLFENPTVAGLAAVAETLKPFSAEQGIVTGPVPLAPIQRWFFAQQFAEAHHWNQSVFLKVKGPIERRPLEQAVERLMARHDALRLKFDTVDDGWEQLNTGLKGDAPIAWVDLSTLPHSLLQETLEREAAAWQRRFDLTEGSLFRVVYFDLGPAHAGRLLVIAHHLVVDGVSWRILLEDLQDAYGKLVSGREPAPATKTTSFKEWAQRLRHYAQSDELRRELPYWIAAAGRKTESIPLDRADGRNTETEAARLIVELSTERTRALLQEVPAAYGTEINDVLLAALAQALGTWTGRRAVRVDLEGHGREDLFEDVDLSRTVGWFTTLFPVRLELTGRGGVGEDLKAVKEQLRRVPRRGIGYGLLRYLCEDQRVRRTMQELPAAAVAFNYLGQFDQVLDADMFYGEAPELRGSERSPAGGRSHLLEINAGVLDRRLRIEWTYSREVHDRGTVQRVADRFADALGCLIDHCLSPEAGGYTPSDFQDAELNSMELDALLTEVGGIA
jgi:non-ribosomal peptide synthase protein (TIGR01720 family)